MTDGTLETIDGRPALRFERTLAHSVERVWRAISDPAELERWFPAAADWTPATGETFEAFGATGEVTEVDAPIAWPGPSAASGTASSWPLRKAAVGWSLPTSSTTVRSPRRPQLAGRPTSRGWSLISPAGTSPKRRHTSRGRKFTNATPSALGSTPVRAGASWRLNVPVNDDPVSPTRDRRTTASVASPTSAGQRNRRLVGRRFK